MFRVFDAILLSCRFEAYGAPLWARGMAWPVLKVGETREAPALMAPQAARFKKGPMRWGKVVLSRSSSGDVDVFHAKLSDGRERVYEVEKAIPHRGLKYTTSDGVEAVSVATERMQYWELNKTGGEAALEKLKLKVRAARTM